MNDLKNITPATDIEIAAIEIGPRLRPVSEATVTALMHVIEDHGFTVPILVRRMKHGLRLIDGAHRLEAMVRRGETHIPCMIATCTSPEARALEATQNLAGASLSPLDDAMFLAAYSATYEELHPETRRGAASTMSRLGVQTELSSFCDVMAEKRSISPRQVRKIVAAGRLISRAEAEQLRSAPRKVTLKDIEEIGKIGEAEERSAVVLRFSAGNAKTAAEARRSLKAEAGGVQLVVKDPVEEAFKALSAIWARAPKAAKRRFVDEHFEELGLLGAEEEEARFEAEADVQAGADIA
jgi:ParB family chromosome partitioning protein